MNKGYILLVFLALLVLVINCSRDDSRISDPSGVLNSSEILLPVKELSSTPPIACWNFNETEGSAVSDHCNGHDGDVIGATWMTGMCGSALEYDGINDCAIMQGGPWLTILKGTLEAWVWIDPNHRRGRIISTEAAGWQNGLHINWGSQLSDDSFINGGIWGGIHSNEGSDHYVETYVDDVSKGMWHFMAFVWDGDANSLLVFVDGQTSTVTSPHPGIMFTGEPLAIGCYTSNGTPQGAWLKGSVDELRLYNRALSIEELTQHYAEGCGNPVNLDIKPGSCPNPINPKSKGKLPVAILGTAEFDVLDIDVSSLLLEGVAPIRSSIEDVSAPVDTGDECDCTEEGPDSYGDLTLKFSTQEIVAAIGPVSPGDEKVLMITGTLLDGTPFEASDCVVVVGGKKDRKNEWIVFARENDVWRVRPDGSDIERVVDLPAGAQPRGIALSPDASRLAYIEYYSEFSTSNRLVLVDIDGSNPQTLVPTGGNGASGVCDFHPDGTHVMYYRDISTGGGQNYELYEVSLDGTSDVNLTNHPNNEGGGSYSPTGDQIAFHSGSAFCSACVSIYTQNHDGTGRTEIFDRCGDSDNTAVWNPDGARILVSSRCPAEEEDLYLIDPDGSNPVQLTNTPGVRERYKAWSPDGNRIVFERSGNLYFIDRGGSGEVLFLNNATWPDWAEESDDDDDSDVVEV